MESYKKALETARNEFGQLARQRGEIDERMGQLIKIIESLVPIVESETALAADSMISALATGQPSSLIDQEAGITEAIKKVFEVFAASARSTLAGVVALTPLEVREWLIKAGWDLSRHTNPMATIHSVLKRLEEQGWLRETEKDGKPAYERTILNSAPFPWTTGLGTSMPSGAMSAMVESAKQQIADANARAGETMSKIVQQSNEAIARAVGPLFKGKDSTAEEERRRRIAAQSGSKGRK